MECFKLNLFAPSLDKKVTFKELTNINLLTILKFVTNRDTKGLSQYFDFLLLDKIEDRQLFYLLNSFDKFILLLQLKGINVNPELKFKSSEKTDTSYTIDLLKEAKRFTESNIITKKEICINDDIIIGLSVPLTLYIENFDDSFIECIQYIKFKDEKIYLNALDEEEKNKIFESITGDNLKKIFSFFEEVKTCTKDIMLLKKNSFIKELNDLEMNMFNNSLIFYLEIIFYENLSNFFEFMYVMVNKVKVNLSEFYELVPSEALIMYNFYKKDIEEQNNEMEKATAPNKGIPVAKH
jgi:hypothetical protein